MRDSNFVAHFTKDGKSDDDGRAYDNLVSILEGKVIKASEMPWTKNPAVCFTECPWSSLLNHIKNYSPFGIGFSKPRVFAAGGGPAYYVRADHWPKQQWDNHIKTFVTPFWPSYRPKPDKIGGPLKDRTVDYSHEREWRVPHDFTFEYDQIEFIVLPDYKSMAQLPRQIKDEIGRDKFILVEVYKRIEQLWPTHVLD